ncbi:hypothetical protein SAMN02910456_01639 [Ruminococcaceae bacterium YRB3002]|nr:hypothetical protein SAMN02910456_01639 [Ruminococcaceae bacterium YRB3002]
MSEVVFLSNKDIQIASGSSSGKGIKITKLVSAPLPEGAVLNGVVMDQDMVIEAIKSAWQTYKLPKSEVTLILNSPQLRANRIDTPMLSDKKITEFISRETSSSEYGRFQKPVTGWYLVAKDSKAKTNKVVYEKAEAEFINKYEEIFDKAGLKLKAIHGGVQLATEFFAGSSAGKTVIYMILDGNSLVTIFFASGKYYYDSTTRVFAQPGTPEFAREIYNAISSIRQFMSAQHLTETVKDVLFAGLTQPQVSSLANDILNIDSQIDVSVVTPPSGTTIADGSIGFPFYIYPIAGVRRVTEGQSILKATKQNVVQSEERKSAMKLAIPFAIILGIVALVYLSLTLVLNATKKELKEVQSYINNPDTQAQVAEYDAMYGNMEDIGKVQGGANLLHKYIDSYPIPDSSVNAKILSAAKPHNVDVDFRSYNAKTGIFKITASSPVVNDINLFIADLMTMDIFQDIDYTGYEIEPDGTRWQINVVCTLAARDADSSKEVN